MVVSGDLALAVIVLHHRAVHLNQQVAFFLHFLPKTDDRTGILYHIFPPAVMGIQQSRANCQSQQTKNNKSQNDPFFQSAFAVWAHLGTIQLLYNFFPRMSRFRRPQGIKKPRHLRSGKCRGTFSVLSGQFTELVVLLSESESNSYSSYSSACNRKSGECVACLR